MNSENIVETHTTPLKKVITEALTNSMTYPELKELTSQLNAQGKTSGHDQSPAMLNYSKMNEVRMKRLDKTISVSAALTEAVKNIQIPQIWLAITEVWCGDGAQNLPLLNKLAQLNPLINLRFVLRDEHPELMNRFLTNGAKSIPVVLALNENMDVLWKWGPRPASAQQMKADYLKTPEPKMSYEEFSEKLHKWYTENKTQMFQEELLELIED